ncbi:uridine kinase [Curtobacterium sp. ME26]|uniref:uridine kinase family protein n=1 Tax=Curtobacterium sp. ME26 TaxID=2744254 RepID=UPI0021750499|nr:phosphoglycerate transporter [Curtobacterium sp. ME26]
MDRDALLDAVRARAAVSDHPLVIGISGYCGSGKSTLARGLVAALPDGVRMRGDDFLDPERSHRRSPDWDGVDRERLVSTVLTPFRAGRPSDFRRYDWSRRALGPAEPIPRAGILVVDLIGLFHPEALPALDMTVWCDVDLETAARRGIARDRRLGRDHEALWHDVWLPNELDFAERFRPQAAVDARVDCASSVRDGSRRPESASPS